MSKEPLRSPGTAPIPEYGLNEGLVLLSLKAREKLAQLKRPIVIGIGGGSASGKSDASRKFVQGMGDGLAVVQPMDNYYHSREYIKSRGLNFDQPEAINGDQFLKDLHSLKAGVPVSVPVYQHGANIREGGEIEPVYEVLQPRDVIVVDGLFALDNAFKNEMDIRVFVEADFYVRMIRRLRRDVIRAKEKPVDILEYFLTVVNPMHERYVQTTKASADMVIINSYAPKVESLRSGLHEFQLKFAGSLDEWELTQLGAERLASVKQTDIYFNPLDRDLSISGESLRIRREAGHSTILTYKGPMFEGPFRERPKLEFKITPQMEQLLLNTYGSQVKQVHKHRTFYQLGGAVIALDSVKGLGQFIEIRPAGKEENRSQLSFVAEKLGLDLNKNIKTPYGFMKSGQPQTSVL